MHRSLLPSILASLGYAIILLATSIPLLQWQINEVVTDFPSTYEVQISSYLLATRLGESLDNDSIRGKVYISKDGTFCRYGDVDIIIRRSRNDESLEQALLIFNKESITRLEEWIAIGIILSGIYIWWFTIWYKRPILEAVGLTGIAIFIFILLTQIVRPFLWRIGASFEHFGMLDCSHGTVTLDVGLSKIHYEMPVVLFAGILLGVGALGVMLRQIIIAVIERKRTSN